MKRYTCSDGVTREVPDDYEECGFCGFDHSYNYESAHAYHVANDPDNEEYK